MVWERFSVNAGRAVQSPNSGNQRRRPESKALERRQLRRSALQNLITVRVYVVFPFICEETSPNGSVLAVDGSA